MGNQLAAVEQALNKQEHDIEAVVRKKIDQVEADGASKLEAKQRELDALSAKAKSGSATSLRSAKAEAGASANSKFYPFMGVSMNPMYNGIRLVKNMIPVQMTFSRGPGMIPDYDPEVDIAAVVS